MFFHLYYVEFEHNVAFVIANMSMFFLFLGIGTTAMSVTALLKTQLTSWITSMERNVSMRSHIKSIKILGSQHPELLFLYLSLPDQRNLGMSMRVERSSLDQVKKRFENNKKKLEEKKKDYDLEQRMKEMREEVKLIF